ncbi:MAG: hypothetical protein DRP42_04350, partial [Tenericutes bacterium]
VASGTTLLGSEDLPFASGYFDSIFIEDSAINIGSSSITSPSGILTFEDGQTGVVTLGDLNSASAPAFVVQVIEGTFDTSTGDGQAYFTIPEKANNLVVTAVHARVITAGTTGTTDIQFNNVTNSEDILSTVLTIDSGETGSDTAATPAVIDTGTYTVKTNDLIRVDVDSVSTTPAKGLIVRLELG